MILKNGHSLRATLPASPNITYIVDYCDHSSAGATDDVKLDAETTSGERTLLAGPASGTQRQVRQLQINNVGSATITLWVGQHDGTATRRRSADLSLRPGEQAVYRDGSEPWTIYTTSGVPRGIDGQTVVATYPAPIRKTGTAPEAAGQYYSYSKDTGSVGAWSPGTPGLAGRVCDGTTAGDAGCIPIPNAGAGQGNYCKELVATQSVAGSIFIYDFLLVNTGIVITTTTAQTLNTVTLPARDADGSTAGRGVSAALLVTTATTNAGAISTITISYTNSDGVSGRTATIPSFPATAVIGTLVPFNLQAGDKGVRSVQSITLGTTLAGGAVSLLLFHQIAQANVPIANSGAFFPAASGARLYDGACLHPVQLATATGAAFVDCQLAIEVRA